MLDYGCGAGEIVRAGLSEGLDICGCEVFYEGGSTREQVHDLLGTRVFELKGGRAPFADESFDLIYSNQVLEHVPDLSATVADMYRLLKPNGLLLSLFPSREVWREGHCGVPFAHRFGYPALIAGRLLGMGYFTQNKSRRQWAADFAKWIEDYCFYRSEAEIMRTYSTCGFDIEHDERAYTNFRFGFYFPEWLFRRLGFMVLRSRKQISASVPHADRIHV
jgi:SAM-dependent methyltransferase